MSIVANLGWAGLALWFLGTSMLFPLLAPGDDSEPETWDNGLATIATE